MLSWKELVVPAKETHSQTHKIGRPRIYSDEERMARNRQRVASYKRIWKDGKIVAYQKRTYAAH